MRRTITLLLALLLAAAVLAACGGDDDTTNQSTAATPTTTAANPAVKTAMNDKLGDILTDASGMTLYTLTKDGADVACTGQCAAVWPPLEGTNYYRFVKDTKPGDVNGEGIESFGGVWHVARPAGATSSGSTATTGAPASSGGGYGY